tara:strand:+ start:47 stop:622 length:576 start_codon:yes stop_codon:yes gene_type:complete
MEVIGYKYQSLESIKNLFIEFSGYDDFDSKTRKRNYVYLRFVYMAICKNYTINSLAVIGESCGGRDHATVLHAMKEFYHHYNNDYFKMYKKIYDEVSSLLESHGAKQVDVTKITEAKIVEARDYYRVRFLHFIDNQRPVINRMKKKIENLRKRQIFEEIALLDDDDLNDFEERSRAFLSMKRIKDKYEHLN